MKIAEIDPEVELLADVPILGPEEDLFDRGLLAARVAELAIAGPPTAPRLVALTGDSGAGKSSVLRLVTTISKRLAGHRRAPAARVALRALILGESVADA